MREKNKWMSKRFYMVSALLLLLAIFTAACGGDGEATSDEDSSKGETDSITFVAWGGTTQEAQEEAWGVPFTEETGIKVNSDNTDYGMFKAMVESGNVVWDVVD